MMNREPTTSSPPNGVQVNVIVIPTPTKRFSSGRSNVLRRLWQVDDGFLEGSEFMTGKLSNHSFEDQRTWPLDMEPDYYYDSSSGSTTPVKKLQDDWDENGVLLFPQDHDFTKGYEGEESPSFRVVSGDDEESSMSSQTPSKSPLGKSRPALGQKSQSFTSRSSASPRSALLKSQSFRTRRMQKLQNNDFASMSPLSKSNSTRGSTSAGHQASPALQQESTPRPASKAARSSKVARIPRTSNKRTSKPLHSKKSKADQRSKGANNLPKTQPTSSSSLSRSNSSRSINRTRSSQNLYYKYSSKRSPVTPIDRLVMVLETKPPISLQGKASPARKPSLLRNFDSDSGESSDDDSCRHDEDLDPIQLHRIKKTLLQWALREDEVESYGSTDEDSTQGNIVRLVESMVENNWSPSSTTSSSANSSSSQPSSQTPITTNRYKDKRQDTAAEVTTPGAVPEWAQSIVPKKPRSHAQQLELQKQRIDLACLIAMAIDLEAKSSMKEKRSPNLKRLKMVIRCAKQMFFCRKKKNAPQAISTRPSFRQRCAEYEKLSSYSDAPKVCCDVASLVCPKSMR